MKCDICDFECFQNNDLFKSCISTLKNTSYDDANESYMSESLKRVINFDLIKRKYANSLELTEEVASSFDALIFNVTDLEKKRIYFVEFKNGNLKKEKTKLNKKALHSLLIFCDIVDKTISFTREHVDFILVYDIDKNPDSSADNSESSATKLSNSPSFGEIVSGVSTLSNQRTIRFGLEKLKKIFFKDVYTLSKKEFQDFLEKNPINDMDFKEYLSGGKYG